MDQGSTRTPEELRRRAHEIARTLQKYRYLRQSELEKLKEEDGEMHALVDSILHGERPDEV